jgi:hypothetical protein
MPKFRVRSPHAIDLPDGRTAAPKDVVTVSERDPEVKALVSEGRLVRVKQSKRGASK